MANRLWPVVCYSSERDNSFTNEWNPTIGCGGIWKCLQHKSWK